MPRPKQSRTTRLQRRLSPRPQARQESTSSDLYGHSDREQERLRNEQQTHTLNNRTTGRNDEVDDVGQRRDLALKRLQKDDIATSSSDVARGRGRAPVGPARQPSITRSGSVLGRGRRGAATPSHSHDSTGLDLDDDVMFDDIDGSFDIDSDNEEATRGRSLANTSTMDTTQLRRHRPRSLSIVGSRDGPIRPSSRGLTTPNVGATFKIGAFRRRVREPSILGTTRKQRPDDPAHDNTPGHDSDTDVDENTVHDTRGKTLTRGTKRKSTESHTGSHRVEKSIRIDLDRGPERNSTPDGDNSDPGFATPRANGNEAADEDIDQDATELSSPESSIPSPLSTAPFVANNRRVVTPEPQDPAVMAPPASSGAEDEDALWPDIQTLAKRRRRLSPSTPLGNRAGDESDISSPPSLTHSPNLRPGTRPSRPTRGRNTRGHVSPKQRNSPKLTSLFSKTRTQRKQAHGQRGNTENATSDEDDDNNDVDSMTLDPDDDELSYTNSHAQRLTKRTGRNQGLSKDRQTLEQAKPTSRAKQARKDSKAKQKRIAQTYGSRRSSNKENESGDDNSGGDGGEEGDEEASRFEPLPEGRLAGSATWKEGDELKKAVKKFKEVDKWELNFEEAVGSSSPPNAR